MSYNSISIANRKDSLRVYVRRTAVVKVIATYIQKRILRVTLSQGPVEGCPYFWIHDMMVDMVRKKV